MMLRTPVRRAAVCVRASVVLLGTLVLLMMSATESFAQKPDPSHWGVNFSLTPAWEMSQRVKDLIGEEGDVINIKGNEFTIGFVRGSTLGGDWGVSYVRKPFDDGLGVSSTDTNCFSPGGNQPQICLRTDEQNFFDKVILNGLEAHWFIAPGFARIKDRVQIGVNVGGGIAKVTGTIRKITDRQEPTFTPGPGGGTVRVVTVHEEETDLAEDELLPVFPLLKIELGAAVIATPALKVKVLGGLNFPGNSFRVSALYLFGAK